MMTAFPTFRHVYNDEWAALTTDERTAWLRAACVSSELAFERILNRCKPDLSDARERFFDADRKRERWLTD